MGETTRAADGGTDLATSGQNWAADRYAAHGRFVADLGAPLIELLGPRPGERILDLGCGDGALTARLAEAGAEVIGFDAAPDLVAAARALGLDVHLGNAHELPYSAEFDAVFSNAALHWMTRPDAVLAGVRRALRPGGRFVGEMGGQGNVASIVVALRAVIGRRRPGAVVPEPWYFPTVAAYQRRLEAQGFGLEAIALVPRPTPLPTDMAGWLETFGGAFFAVLPEAERRAALEEVVSLLAPALRDDEGRWTADYVRLRFAARLP